MDQEKETLPLFGGETPEKEVSAGNGSAEEEP